MLVLQRDPVWSTGLSAVDVLVARLGGRVLVARLGVLVLVRVLVARLGVLVLVARLGVLVLVRVLVARLGVCVLVARLGVLVLVRVLVARLGVLVVADAIGITSPDKHKTIVSMKSACKLLKNNEVRTKLHKLHYVWNKKFSENSQHCTHL